MSLRSDPRRLPRRNHYQEGPDFLFVATQGGRPMAAEPCRSPVAVVRGRARTIRLWSEGASVVDACGLGGCSRATLFRWRERFERDGLAGLLDRPRPGDASDLAPDLERAILLVRMLSYWNSRRIAAEFGRRGITVSHGQVDRLLARSGTNRTSTPRVPGPRYERTSPNELWHIDLKGPFYLPTATGGRRPCHFVALVDDFSRFLLGIRAVPSREALPILEALAEAIDLCGVPHELMTDNGTPFVAVLRSMLSRFQRSLAELEIRHIRTQIDTPWTNGKIESFWATLQAEVLDRQHLADLAAADAAVTAYAAYYNYHRLHGELGWRTPAERFDGTPFVDRGFEHVPSLVAVADLLADLLAA
jgi:transposase InsO family protein